MLSRGMPACLLAAVFQHGDRRERRGGQIDCCVAPYLTVNGELHPAVVRRFLASESVTAC